VRASTSLRSVNATASAARSRSTENFRLRFVCKQRGKGLVTIASCAHESHVISIKLPAVIYRSLIKSALGGGIDVIRHYDNNRYFVILEMPCHFVNSIDISYLAYTYRFTLFNGIHSFCFQNINTRPTRNFMTAYAQTLSRHSRSNRTAIANVTINLFSWWQDLLKKRPWITVRFNSRDTRRLQRKRISGCKAEIVYRRCVAEMDQCPREWIAESLVCSLLLLGEISVSSSYRPLTREF